MQYLRYISGITVARELCFVKGKQIFNILCGYFSTLMLSTLQNVNTYLFTRTVRFLWIDKCSSIMMKPHYNETNKQTNKQTNKKKLILFVFHAYPPENVRKYIFWTCFKTCRIVSLVSCIKYGVSHVTSLC